MNWLNCGTPISAFLFTKSASSCLASIELVLVDISKIAYTYRYLALLVILFSWCSNPIYEQYYIVLFKKLSANIFVVVIDDRCQIALLTARD